MTTIVSIGLRQEDNVKRQSETDLLRGAAEDLRLAIGRHRRAVRRLHQLAVAHPLPLYEEQAAHANGDLDRLERLAASIRARLAVVEASSQRREAG